MALNMKLARTIKASERATKSYSRFINIWALDFHAEGNIYRPFYGVAQLISSLTLLLFRLLLSFVSCFFDSCTVESASGPSKLAVLVLAGALWPLQPFAAAAQQLRSIELFSCLRFGLCNLIKSCKVVGAQRFFKEGRCWCSQADAWWWVGTVCQIRM